MKNKVQFRNHFSIIFERSLRGIGILFFVFVGSFLSDMEEMETSQILSESMFMLVVLLIVLVFVIGYQVLIWAKTTITITENTIVVERKTLNRKVNTIGIKSISNVNLEQNMLQMLLGTNTVKLDTNSLSTANETDVTIVLKKKDAEAFRRAILNTEQEENVATSQGTHESLRKYVSNFEETLLHGLFATKIWAVVILLALMGMIFIFVEGMLNDPELGLMEALSSILVFGGYACIWLWNILKNFVRYANFQIERKGNKIFLNYGIFKKVAYSIPVDKINAVKLNQTTIARIGKRYTAEVINVGMDDDEKEVGSFFLPYVKQEKLKQLFEWFLPEFSDCLEIEGERQPKSIWKLWIPVAISYLVIMAAVFGISMELAWTHMGDSDGFEWVLLLGIGILSAILFICKVASYFTKRCGVKENFLQIVSGRFAKQTIYIKYDKIQYLAVKQNALAKKYGIEKGCVHILASLKNQVHQVPYCKKEVIDKLRNLLLAPSK